MIRDISRRGRSCGFLAAFEQWTRTDVSLFTRSFIPYSAARPHICPMKNAIAAFVAAVGVAGALVAGFVGPVLAQDGACLDRREIQEKIDSGELIQLSEAMNAAGVDGKIISSAAQVCEVNGRWAWRVNVMDSSGESRPVTLPAQ